MAKGGNVMIALGTSTAHPVRIPLWGGDAQNAHTYSRDGASATIGQVDLSHPALA